MSNLLVMTRQKHFETSNKPQIYSSGNWKENRQKLSSTKSSQKLDKFLNQQDIIDCIKELYSDHNTFASTATKIDYSQLFNSLTLPQLNEGNQHFLEGTFSVAELIKAFKPFHRGKCPVPDGFGAKFDQSL